MKVTLESTSKVITLIVNGREVPARIWEGQTEPSGHKVHAYITRIACDEDDELAKEEFKGELEQSKKPSIEIDAIPLRMII